MFGLIFFCSLWKKKCGMFFIRSYRCRITEQNVSLRYRNELQILLQKNKQIIVIVSSIHVVNTCVALLNA
jgi:hypothetical protein